MLDDRTITLSAIDPLQDAPGNDDDVAIPVGELPKDRPVLIVRTGPQAGARFTLDSDVTRLGRHPDSEISLDDITVSRRHAEVQRTAEGYMAMIDELDRATGIDKVRCIHMNDSKRECGSRVDRHEHIGKGKIGKTAFAHFINDPRFRAVPMILETPKGVDGRGTDLDVVNLNRLRALFKCDL